MHAGFMGQAIGCPADVFVHNERRFQVSVLKGDACTLAVEDPTAAISVRCASRLVEAIRSDLADHLRQPTAAEIHFHPTVGGTACWGHYQHSREKPKLGRQGFSCEI